MSAQLAGLDGSVRRLAELLSQGLITLAEFDEQRQTLLTSYVTAPNRRFSAPPATGLTPRFAGALPSVSRPPATYATPTRLPATTRPAAFAAPALRLAVQRPPTYRDALAAREALRSPAFGAPQRPPAAPAAMPTPKPRPTLPGRPAPFQPLASAPTYPNAAPAARPPPEYRRLTSAPAPTLPRGSMMLPRGQAPTPIGPIRTPLAAPAARFQPYAPPAPVPTAAAAAAAAAKLRPTPTGQTRTVVVRPIPFDTQQDEVGKRMAEFGDVSSVVLQQGDLQGLGCAVVSYVAPEGAQLAATTQYVEFQGVYCYVQRDTGRGSMMKKPETAVLVLYNLPNEATQSELREVLAPHQGFLAIMPTVPATPTQAGYACVRFSTVAHARQARQALLGLVVHGHLVEPCFGSMTPQGTLLHTV